MDSLKYAFKKEWYNIVMLLLPFVVLPLIWELMPSQIPVQWNFQGEVSSYGDKFYALLMLPVGNILIYLIMLYLPVIDPKKRIEIDQKPIPTLRTLLVILFLGMSTWVTVSAMEMQVETQSWLYLGLAIFVTVAGNYLRTIKPNYFLGIRLPWTLESEENWRKTHKLGSYVWVAGGILMLLLFPFLPFSIYSTVFTIAVLAIAIIPVGYSFYLFKQTG